MRWFNRYKISESNEENALLFDSKVHSLDETVNLIQHANLAYKDLMIGRKRSKKNFWLGNK